jgi:hypothetical protein
VQKRDIHCFSKLGDKLFEFEAPFALRIAQIACDAQAPDMLLELTGDCSVIAMQNHAYEP